MVYGVPFNLSAKILATRVQFEFTVAFQIAFAALSIGLASYPAVLIALCCGKATV